MQHVWTNIVLGLGMKLPVTITEATFYDSVSLFLSIFQMPFVKIVMVTVSIALISEVMAFQMVLPSM